VHTRTAGNIDIKKSVLFLRVARESEFRRLWMSRLIMRENGLGRIIMKVCTIEQTTVRDSTIFAKFQENRWAFASLFVGCVPLFLCAANVRRGGRTDDAETRFYDPDVPQERRVSYFDAGFGHFLVLRRTLLRTFIASLWPTINPRPSRATVIPITYLSR
jgi:hypothetical protein